MTDDHMRSPAEQDLRDRWRPSAEQVAAADARLTEGHRYVFTTHLLLNKSWGVWNEDVEVHPLDGVYLDRDAAFSAVEEAVTLARAQLGTDKIVGGYALHAEPGQWAVWDLP